MANITMNDLLIDAGAIDKNSARWAELGRNWAAFDRVYMTEEQALGLADKVTATAYFSSDFLARPSIPEFTVILQEEGREENTYTCFRRTLMKNSDFVFPETDGLSRTMEPFIDAYFYINNGGKFCNFVATFCRVTAECRGRSMTFTVQVPTYRHDDPYSRRLISSDRTYFQEFLRTAKCIYLGVQMLSLERPEVMAAETVQETHRTTVKKKGRHKSVNKVSFVKVIRIPDEAFSSGSRGHHSMTCPCWGVAGHWRTCKSGKQVWVRPYRKGKKRNDPGAYQPKQYEFPKEDN